MAPKRGAASADGPLGVEQREAFERDGFIVLSGLLPGSELRPLRRELRGLTQQLENEPGTATTSTVPPSDRAACQFEKDSAGVELVPRRLFKLQGAALSRSRDSILALVRNKGLARTALQLARVRTEIDAFGTKFFPVPPGCVGSVGWHDDNYYFGTCRSRTISCVCYLRDTAPENGCLRVVPGSHHAKVVGPDRGHM